MAFLPPQSLIILARLLAVGGVTAGAVVGLRHVSPEGGAEAPPTSRTVNRYVYRSFTSEADTLYLGSVEPGSTPRKIADIPHAREWGIRAAVSPDGRWVAYTAMPPGARRPEIEADLWVVGTDGSGKRRLATGVDLLSTPVWRVDSGAVTARRYPKLGDGVLPQRLELVELSGRSMLLVERDATLGLYPIGFAGSRLVFAELTPDGTEIFSISGGRERREVHASDGVARDWTLSPDGEQLAFLAPVESGGDVLYRAFRVELGAGGGPVEARAGSGEQLGPAWRAGSDELTIGGPATGGGPVSIRRTGEMGSSLPRPRGGGFDQPLAWSPDGRLLALRAFSGATPDDPGASRDLILLASGERVEVPPGPNAFVGWVAE